MNEMEQNLKAAKAEKKDLTCRNDLCAEYKHLSGNDHSSKINEVYLSVWSLRKCPFSSSANL
ncbi:hypothetical protein HF325_000482 [Metschnikowia pulcherrima]|uniref:Uncharacterized protein n=1 Tax=Metschnikowia pulcherrima TaxID=27326 RepID=A0A8H7LEU8_9ASCO|nr:hypothetical protein HF325_000482 [Metschnikowia pulcherrima]